MSYTDLRDFAPEYTEEIDGLKVQIEKLGGGTLGNSYEGTWRYIVTDAAGTEVTRGQDFVSRVHRTHGEVARLVVEYLTPEI